MPIDVIVSQSFAAICLISTGVFYVFCPDLTQQAATVAFYAAFYGVVRILMSKGIKHEIDNDRSKRDDCYPGKQDSC